MADSHSLRPRRSVLYMPGSNARALEKAKTLPADSLVLDLEDAVAPSQKAEARQQILSMVQAGGYGNRELVVRVNGLSTPWGMDDIAAFVDAPIAAVCLPKVESAQEIATVSAMLNQSVEGSGPDIWAMIETPAGVIAVEEIAAADPRLTLLMMGTSDLAKELRVPHTADRIGFLYALSRCVIAARANNLDIIDGVYLDLQDDVGFRLACEQGRQLGFDGKSLIHPKQLSAANEVYSPHSLEVERAEKILVAWQEAEVQGSAVVLVDGKLVEILHVEEAKRTLAIWEAIKASS